MLLRKLKPSAIVGFGGYPTVPPLMAASMLGIPGVLHEGNAVIGRANKFLARRVGEDRFRLSRARRPVGGRRRQTRLHRQPLRPAVLEAAKPPFPPLDGPIGVLVTGGSQGARVMGEVVPAAFALLSADERARFHLTLPAIAAVVEAKAVLAFSRLTPVSALRDTNSAYRATSRLFCSSVA